MNYHIADLDKFVHIVPVIIVFIAGVFHIANSVWKHLVTLLRRMIRDVGKIYREFRNLIDDIFGAGGQERRDRKRDH